MTSSESPLFFGSMDPAYSPYDRYTPIPYPLLDNEPPDTRRYASVYWVMVNPYSDHVDLAVRCIGELAKMAGNMRWEYSPIYRDEANYEDLVKRMYPQEKLDRAGAFIQDCFVGIDFPGFREVMRILNAYAAGGDKSLDETIEEAQRILDMMREEQFLDR